MESRPSHVLLHNFVVFGLGVLGMEPEPGPCWTHSGRQRFRMGCSLSASSFWGSALVAYFFSSKRSDFLLPFSFYSDCLLLSLLLNWAKDCSFLTLLCGWLCCQLKRYMIFLSVLSSSHRARALGPYLCGGWMYTHLVPGRVWAFMGLLKCWLHMRVGLRPSSAGCKL